MAAAELETQGAVTALLEKGASFDGRLTFEGTVRIGGHFRGSQHHEESEQQEWVEIAQPPRPLPAGEEHA